MKNNKEQRVEIFKKLETHFIENIKNKYKIDERAVVIDLNNQKSKYNVLKCSVTYHKENVTETINKYKEPLVLIFGSATKAGGGVINGASAQEEDIALKTTWYFHAKNNPEYYNIEHKSLCYTELALYVKNGLILTDTYDFPITPEKISFIACAAPNLTAMKNKKYKYDDNKIYKIVQSRIRNIFKFAEAQKHSTLIVGAWGCGVFGLSAERVAKAYKTVLQENHFGGHLVFSIMDDLIHDTFKYIIEKPISDWNIINNHV